jgi:uncharacterized membrane protein
MKRMSTPRIIVTVITALLVATGLQGCYYDKEELLYHKTGAVDCTTVSAKFSTDVAPLIQNKCATAGCHNAAGAAGGTVLETYTQIAGVSARVYQRCVVDKTMPTSGPLSTTEIAIISCWVNSGTPNN